MFTSKTPPLGWVIFGATPGDAHETNSINYVKYTMPEDLSDFWTIESMGVAVEKPQLPLDQHWTFKMY